jgi:DNA-binding MarR family transcriptional regulator
MKEHNHDILNELATLFFATKQLIRERLPEKSLDPNAWPRFETMRYIESEGEPTMQDIARYLRVRAPSATSLVAHLVRMGFASRRLSRSDRRVTRIQLTGKGRRSLTAHRKHSVKALRQVFSKLNAKEIHELVRTLRLLQDRHRGKS